MKRRILAPVAALCLGLPGCTQELADVADFTKELEGACPSAGLDDESEDKMLGEPVNEGLVKSPEAIALLRGVMPSVQLKSSKERS